MGVNQGSKYLHSVSKLTLVEISSICMGLARELSILPRVVVDCSNLAFVYSNYISPTDAVAKHLARFATPGIVIVPVCDGVTRPISKQATNSRMAKKELCRITALCLRNQIRLMRDRIANDSCADKESLANEIANLSRKLKANETQATQSMPKNFVEELDHELRQTHAYSVDNESAGGYVEEVVVSEFQADAYMAGQIISRAAVMALTRDSDIPIIIGDCCICIKTFTKGNYEIVSTSEATLQMAMQFLGNDSTATLTKASVPLFDGVTNPRMRALLMLMLGCDVYQPGMERVGGITLLKMINGYEHKSSDDKLFQFLRDQFMKTNKLSEDAVDTYIDASVFEPTNATPDVNAAELPQRTYMFGVPLRLPRYLEQYSADVAYKSSRIFDGPEMCTCKGVHGRTHVFLRHEGHSFCAECNDTVCKSCQGMVDKQVFCLGCFTTRAIAPIPQLSTLTVAEMRLELKDKYNFDGAQNLDIIEVEDAYLSIGYIDKYRKQETNVPFPMYPTSNLHSPERPWTDVIDVDFQAAGAFITDPNLSGAHIPSVLKLFGSFVKFDSTESTTNSKEMTLRHILPTNFFLLAANCRVDSGYRVLQRCIRHATDSRFPSIDKQIAKLINHNGELGIHLSALVPASMKNCSYKSEIVLTPTKILCCKCSCPCGSQNKERTLCVHNLPLVYSLTLHLFRNLADHIIREVAACIRCNIWNNVVWSAEDQIVMKQSIILLTEAAGDPVDKHNIRTVSIEDLIDDFLVGTEKRREWKKRTSAPPKPFELGPIKNMTFPSTRNQGGSQTKRRHQEDTATIDSNSQSMSPLPTTTVDEVSAYLPNYLRISLLINAAKCDNVASKKFIGVRLLQHRSLQQMHDIGNTQLTSFSQEIDRGWKDLQVLQRTRSRRYTPRSKDPSLSQPIVTASPMRKRAVETDECGPPPKKRPSMRCFKCKKTNLSTNAPRFHCVPIYPAPHLHANPTLQQVIQRQGRILLHEEMMDRLRGARKPKKPRKVFPKTYFCEDHEFETIVASKTFEFDGENHTRRYKLTGLIKGAGMKSSAVNYTSASKGLGRDRSVRKKVEKLSETMLPPTVHVEMAAIHTELLHELQSKNDDNTRERSEKLHEIEVGMLRSDLAGRTLALQHVVEETCTSRVPINQSVRVVAGMGLQIGNAELVPVENRPFVHSDLVKKRGAHLSDMGPIVDLRMRDSEVKRRTGFRTKEDLLSYIFVVCDGDINTVQMRSSSLTWFEEWFMHFEHEWGRTTTRWDDIIAVFGVHPREATTIFDQKTDMEFRTQQSWPPYASYNEDLILRNTKKWGNKYDDERPVMWDMTNIPAYAFTDTDLQRLTYSEYYGMNCFKGGVFVQLCGWMGTADLWPGRVTDSDYNRREGYLERQREFQEHDKVIRNGEDVVVPFLNIYDKGYHAHMAAWSHGNQRVLQPVWAKSGERFTRMETIASASVATDRGGNERAVNVAKRPGHVDRGFQPNTCPKRFNKAWLVSSFRANFTYEPVL